MLAFCPQAKVVPRSQDLTDQSLQAEEPLGGQPLKINSSSTSSNTRSSSTSMPGFIRSKANQQEGSALVQEVQQKGAKRTQQLIQQNQHLPAAEKVALANSERIKGNEHFKWVWYRGARNSMG